MKSANVIQQTKESDIAMGLLTKLAPMNRAFCSIDYERAVDYLCEVLPFEVIRFRTGEEHNGWVVPPRVEIKEAKILKQGRTIYDASLHPVRVIMLPKPFCGVVSGSELRAHFHYDARNPKAVPFHFRQQYRPWRRDWGFCVTKEFYDSIDNGSYEIVLTTEESKGHLSVLSYRHEGRFEETFAFVSHLDHPGMANDGLSGCAAGVELLSSLRGRATRYSYQLVLVPEIIGSEFFLAKNAQIRRLIREAVFLDGVASQTPVALQKSMNEKTALEQAVEEALQVSQIPYSTGAFKSICANDETIWEAYGIPMAGLSRFPYPEYHTDLDNLSLISKRHLEESLEILKRSIEFLELSRQVVKKFTGTVCLSNPKYDLYVDTGQPAFSSVEVSKKTQALRRLMEFIPTMRCAMTVKAIARRVDISEDLAMPYLKKWQDKGLIELK